MEKQTSQQVAKYALSWEDLIPDAVTKVPAEAVTAKPGTAQLHVRYGGAEGEALCV